MKMTGAEILCESLTKLGVRHIFGYPGGAILPVYDALGKSKLHHILVRHEQGATHMADGYARARRRRGRGHGYFRPGRHQHGHRHRHRDARFFAGCLHHRPGQQQGAGFRRLSGNRHHRNHHADHQAQRGGDARRGYRAHRSRSFSDCGSAAGLGLCWSTSPRMRNRHPANSTGKPALQSCRPNASA